MSPTPTPWFHDKQSDCILDDNGGQVLPATVAGMEICRKAGRARTQEGCVMHTPTPWRYDQTTLSWYIWPEKGAWICSGVLPADTWHMEKGEKDKTSHIANARFIVKAVNAHDELVAALRAIADGEGDADEIARQTLAKVGAL